MSLWRYAHRASLLMLISVIAGCGPSGRSPLAKVTGMVTYKGEPVEQAQIVFHNPQGRSAIGQVTDGTIENVTTYDTLNDGAAVGTLKVTIHPLIDRDSMQRPIPGRGGKSPPKTRANPPFPLRYSDSELSGLTADILPGDNEVYFDLSD